MYNESKIDAVFASIGGDGEEKVLYWLFGNTGLQFCSYWSCFDSSCCDIEESLPINTAAASDRGKVGGRRQMVILW